MHVLNDRGLKLCLYSTAVMFFLIGIPAISTERGTIMWCLLGSTVILFFAAVLRTRYSKEYLNTDVYFLHIDLMIKLGLSLMALRALLWLIG